MGVQVAIYADHDPGGKKLIATLRRRLKNEEIRAWQVKKTAPFTLIHSGDRYTKIRVTFVPAGTASFSRAARAGALGAFLLHLLNQGLALISEPRQQQGDDEGGEGPGHDQRPEVDLDEAEGRGLDRKRKDQIDRHARGGKGAGRRACSHPSQRACAGHR